MKKINKYLLSIGFIFLFMLPSCSKRNKNISLFLYTSNDAFINSLYTELVYKFSDYNLSVDYAQRSQVIQNRQITRAIDNNESSILLVNTVDRLASGSIVEKAKSKQIPLIFINREPLLEDIVDATDVYYVGTNPTNEGILQAQIVDSLFNGSENFINSKYDKNKDGKLQVVLLKGEQGHQDTEQRSNSSINELNRLGYEVDLINTTFCDWSKDIAYSNFKMIYNEFFSDEYNTDIELLLSNNDDMALGAIDFILDNEQNDEDNYVFYEKYFPIVGVDYTEESKKYIDQGYLYGTVRNKADIQADAIYKLTIKLIKKESLDDFEYELTDGKFIRTNGEIVCQSNI